MGKMHSEFDTVGQRLTQLRSAAGLTREAIEKNYRIKSSSLRSWETDARGLKQKTAKDLSAIYKNYGIDCSEEWIMEGKGPNPLDQLSLTPEKNYLLKEVIRFKAFYPNAVVIEVLDDNMAPWIYKRDLVGGMFTEELESLNFIDHLCIVKTEEFGMQVRLVKQSDRQNLYNLISFADAGSIFNIKLLSVARVIFLRQPVELENE